MLDALHFSSVNVQQKLCMWVVTGVTKMERELLESRLAIRSKPMQKSMPSGMDLRYSSWTKAGFPKPVPAGANPVYKVVRTSRLYEQIVQQIEESVLNGSLKPGDQLPAERDLAQRLGVSRTAVRERVSRSLFRPWHIRHRRNLASRAPVLRPYGEDRPAGRLAAPGGAALDPRTRNRRDRG